MDFIQLGNDRWALRHESLAELFYCHEWCWSAGANNSASGRDIYLRIDILCLGGNPGGWFGEEQKTIKSYRSCIDNDMPYL